MKMLCQHTYISKYFSNYLKYYLLKVLKRQVHTIIISLLHYSKLITKTVYILYNQTSFNYKGSKTQKSLNFYRFVELLYFIVS